MGPFGTSAQARFEEALDDRAPTTPRAPKVEVPGTTRGPDAVLG